MTLTDSTQAPYTPLIWDATLPRAEGVIATHFHNNVPTNDQVHQSAALFRLINAQDQTAFDALQSITTPAPMLIQNPGTNTVRFIMGTAKFLADPIRHPTGHPLQSSFLAIGEDLVEHADTPRAIILPDDVLKTNMVKIPTAPQFRAKLTQKAAELPEGGGTAGAQFDTSQWFKHSDAGTVLFPLAKLCPAPPFLAYDAFLDNVAAHIVWERIAFHEDQHPQEAEFFTGVKHFLQGVHTKHLTAQCSTSVPRDTFQRRPHRDATQWAKTRLRHILPLSTPITPPRQIHTGPPGGDGNVVTGLHDLIREIRRVTPPSTPPDDPTAPATETDPHSQQKKKYGVAGEDFLHLLKLCGLAAGQEEILPAHYSRMAETHLSTDGKDRIAKEVLETLRYTEHHVPAHPLILRLLKNKQFSGDDDSTSKEAVMKGLTPYLVVDISEDEVQIATAHEDAVALASSTTTSDIKALFNKKAAIPKSFANLVSTLKRFANLLQCLFGGQCPLLALVCTLIRHMTSSTATTLRGMDSRTIASTMWVVHKETRLFAAGKLENPGKASINWIHMQTSILTAQSLHRNDVPLGIDGMGGDNTKQQSKTAAAPTKRKEPEGGKGASLQSPDKVKLRDIETKYEVHPRVAAEIAPRIPFGIKMKALMERLKVNKNVFGIQNLCWHAALRGKCIYNNCPKDHEATAKIDDAAVDLALSNLAPIFKNIESKGKNQS